MYNAQGIFKDLTFLKIQLTKVKQLMGIKIPNIHIMVNNSEWLRQSTSILLTFLKQDCWFIPFQVLMLPSALIGTATAQVFFQRASEERNNGRPIKGIVQSIHQSLIIIGFLPMIIIFIIGQDLFGLIFGANWSIAGIYAKWLIPWIFLMFISSPLTSSIVRLSQVIFILLSLLLSSSLSSLSVFDISSNFSAIRL